MTKLKAVLTSLDGIDAAIQPFYTEKDGSFILNIEGVPEHPEVKTLQSALTAARKDAKDAKKEVTDIKTKYANVPDDFDADAYHAVMDGGKDINKQLTDQAARLRKESDTKIAAATAETEKYKTKLTKVVSESALNNALQECNVAPEMVKPVRAMFGQQVKVEFEGDEPVVTLDGLPVSEKVKAWAATEEGKHFVRAADNSGGGSRPNGPGGTKFDYEKATTTELMQMNNKGDAAAAAEMTRRSLPGYKPAA